jgi:predicted TIM-barrel fold metal-dependent hydrolase
MSRARCIDVHAHPPLARGLVGDLALAWDRSTALRALDALEIDAQTLSLPFLPNSDPTLPPAAAHTARTLNRALSAILEKCPDRIGAFATVPADNPDEAAEEAEYALDQLGLDGIALTSNNNGRLLGDELFAGVLSVTEARRVPVFLHPSAPSPGDASGRPAFLIDYPIDTARSIVDAIYQNVFSRHPQLALIVAHCGGALPALAWRIQHLRSVIDTPEAPDGDQIRAALQSLYYETALSGSRSVLAAVLQITDSSHLLFGTDSGAPATTPLLINEDRAGVASHLAGEQLHQLLHGNAETLFPRFAAASRGQ